MKSRSMLFAATVATAMMPFAAFADTPAMTTTDLNLRAGPGPNYEVVATMPVNAQVSLSGCTEGGSWCQVSYSGTTGWASANYLRGDFGGQQVVVAERRSEIPVVSFAGNVVGGAVAGALNIAGAAVNAALTPPRAVLNYVTENRYDPVYLDGEVVVGAGIPANVELRTIPDYDYNYAYINGQPVLVDPSSRQIVYVYR